MPVTALGAVVLLQTATRRVLLRGREAEILEEYLENLEEIRRLHTGSITFHISQGSISLEVSRRGPPRKRTRLVVAEE